MSYSGESYEFLFTTPCGKLTKGAYEILRHINVAHYRVKTIQSGQVLECEIYPLWKEYDEVRAAREHTTREAQANLNERNARKRIARLIDTNFTPDDLHVTLTYGKSELPDEDQARRDIRNFLRRVRAYRKKNNMPELKYVYVIEFSDGDGRRTRVHHHVIMSGMDRKAVKALWPHGRARVDELEPEDGTLEGLARYITKQPNKRKRWQASRNLEEPTITIENTKLSRRQAERLAEDVKAAGTLVFEKLYPGYTFNRCDVRRSRYVAGAYIYAKMNKAPPQKRKRRE